MQFFYFRLMETVVFKPMYHRRQHCIGIEFRKSDNLLKIIKILLSQNTIDDRQKEFLEKFYKLSEEYNCGIQYHPKLGMVVIDYKN